MAVATAPVGPASSTCTPSWPVEPTAPGSSTWPTAPSTARSVRCCWRPRARAWSGWPSTWRTTTPCSQRLATDISPRILRAPPRLDEAARQLDEYFAGSRRAFDLPVDLRLAHGFRRDVLDHLLAIPYGRTESYAEVARAAGNPKAVRAVGSACAHNPVPVVVPCHRVVRSDGSIGQYLGGTETKVWLLALESAA